MDNEKEKILSDKLLSASGKELGKERQWARTLIYFLNNHIEPENIDDYWEIVNNLFGKLGKGFWLEPPFYCDYGYNIEAGDNVFINYGCTLLDCAKITLGNNVLIGPHAGIYTAEHPIDPKQRRTCINSRPVVIGDNVWIGAHAIINPGVSVGENSVIGYGSVVTKDIPSNVIAVGNPCKIIKNIPIEVE